MNFVLPPRGVPRASPDETPLHLGARARERPSNTHTVVRVGSALLLVVAGACAVSGTAQAATHTWGTAVALPGMTALSSVNPSVNALSCASTGNCSAGGQYEDGSGSGFQAWVANAVNGSWQDAQQVPGVASLNTGGKAGLISVSCPSAGNCTAGGFYRDNTGPAQVWVADEVNGTWQNAQQIPGTAALNAASFAEFGTVSCASAGNCSAGGSYEDSQSHFQAFVVNEVNGTWQNAFELAGTAGLNAGGSAAVDGVSCAGAGNCSAVGGYTDGSSHRQVFAANEVNGVWRTAHEIPGIGSLNAGGLSHVDVVSCASAGNCGASGYYADSSLRSQAFVVNEVGGTWRTAREVPGTATLNKGGSAEADTVFCRSAGNCTAGGYYTDGSHRDQAFVVNEVSGTWHTAREVPGSATLNKGGSAAVTSVSCSSAGTCSAGGSYRDASGHDQAMVADETGGTWGTARQVPGTSALNVGGFAYVYDVACVPSGSCAAAGTYEDSSGQSQIFVVNRS